MWKHKNVVPVLLSFGILCAILALFSVISWTWCFVIILLYMGLATWGSLDIRLSYFTEIFYRKRYADGQTLALTFDDGPTPITRDLLDLLREYDAKATFFCIGRQINKYPDIFKQIVEEGHVVGNHTMNHSRAFGLLNENQVVQEIDSCDAIIQDIIPHKTRFFRPPFGVTNPAVAKAVKQTKHQIIGWNRRSLVMLLQNEDKIFERITKRLKSGDIILFHDTSPKTLRVVRRVLEYMKQRDMRSVTVEQLLSLEAYAY